MAFTVLAALLMVAGLALLVVGALGLLRRLPRNRFAGVRTANTLRDAEAFAVANHVAALPTLAAGGIALVGGAAGLSAPGPPLAVTLVAMASIGTVVLTVAGGLLGDRAAGQLPSARFAGCGGSCACCERATTGAAEAEAGPEVSSPG
jgi:hypothetical protein